MASRRARITVSGSAEVPENHEPPKLRLNPFREFLGPARRRTDNQIVVGTVVLCLGLMALTSIIQIAATVWAGSQVRLWLDAQDTRDEEVKRVRMALFENTRASSVVLRRLCLNTAQTDRDKQQCLDIVPPITPPSLLPRGVGETDPKP